MAHRRGALRSLIGCANLFNKLIKDQTVATALMPATSSSLLNHLNTYNVAHLSTNESMFSPQARITERSLPVPFSHSVRFASSSSSRKNAAIRRLQRANERAVARSQQAASGVEQPPSTAQEQTVLSPLETPPSAVQCASVVNHPALIVARPIEWGTVLLGFEQANRYTIYDEAGTVRGHLYEDEGSIGKAIGRQILRVRRPFTATVFSPDGTQVIFRLRRPMYLINSSIFIEDGEGNQIGEVHQRWHLWKRQYDLYFNMQQFAAIEGGFLAWDFELKDQHGKTLALIDRNFNGFGKELFTDAGKYVVHFGETQTEAVENIRNTIQAAHPDKPAPPVTAIARVRNDLQVIPTSSGNQLVVHRPLQLSERMIALAAAISIDYDYFSRHSYGGGALSPFIHPPIIPYPVPMGGGGGTPIDAEAGETPSGESSSGAAAEASDETGGAFSRDQSYGASEQQPLERDLGSDTWDVDDNGDGGMFGGGGDDDEGGGFGGLFDSLKDMMGDWDDS